MSLHVTSWILEILRHDKYEKYRFWLALCDFLHLVNICWLNCIPNIHDMSHNNEFLKYIQVISGIPKDDLRSFLLVGSQQILVLTIFQHMLTKFWVSRLSIFVNLKAIVILSHFLAVTFCVTYDKFSMDIPDWKSTTWKCPNC